MPPETLDRVRGLSNVDVVYDAEAIAERVTELGREIGEYYRDGEL